MVAMLTLLPALARDLRAARVLAVHPALRRRGRRRDARRLAARRRARRGAARGASAVLATVALLLVLALGPAELRRRPDERQPASATTSRRSRARSCSTRPSRAAPNAPTDIIVPDPARAEAVRRRSRSTASAGHGVDVRVPREVQHDLPGPRRASCSRRARARPVLDRGLRRSIPKHPRRPPSAPAAGRRSSAARPRSSTTCARRPRATTR